MKKQKYVIEAYPAHLKETESILIEMEEGVDENGREFDETLAFEGVLTTLDGISKSARPLGFLEKKIITMDTPDGERQIIDLPKSVCFVPLTTDGYYIFGKQYRAAAGRIGIATYGGYMDPNESPTTTAVREMFEECNIEADKVDKLRQVYDWLFPSIGISNELNTMYLIKLNCTKAELDVKSNDVNEGITPVFVTAKEMASYEFTAQITGMKTYIAKEKLLIWEAQGE